VVFLPPRIFVSLHSMSDEKKIRDLCAKVSSAPEGSTEFWQALTELRDALQEHIELLRQARENKSKDKSKTSIRRAS